MQFFWPLLAPKTDHIPTGMGRQQPSSTLIAYPCGKDKCSKEVSEGIQCDSCLAWYHPRCSKLSIKAYKLYTEHQCLKWVCEYCSQVSKAARGGLGGKNNPAPTVDKPLDVTVVNRWSDIAGSGAPEITMDIKALEELRERVEKQESEFILFRKKASALELKLSKLTKESDLALGRHRNVVVKGIPEPVCPATKQRTLDIRRHLEVMFRSAGINGNCILRRVFRLGKWKRPEEGIDAPPRPVLVEFANPRIRDAMLTAAGTIKSDSKGQYTVEPDLSKGKLRAEGASLAGDSGTRTCEGGRRQGSPRLRIPRMQTTEITGNSNDKLVGQADRTSDQASLLAEYKRLFGSIQGATSSPVKCKNPLAKKRDGHSEVVSECRVGLPNKGTSEFVGDLKILCTNACSINNKWKELAAAGEGFHCMAVTETWVKEGSRIDTLTPRGYLAHRSDRPGGRDGGGALLLVSDDLQQITGPTLSTPNVQVATCHLTSGGHLVNLVCAYRSSSSTPEEDLELLRFLLTMLASPTTTVITGDFNAPEVDWENLWAPGDGFGDKLLEFVLNGALTQHVRSPTRFREGNTPGLLDLAITRFPNEIGTIEIGAPLGKSDHGVLRFAVSCLLEQASDK